MQTVTLEKLQEILDSRFGGAYKSGKHEPNGKACLLEFDSQVRAILDGDEENRKQRWNDNPGNLPDFRALNDAFGNDDAERTAALLPVHAALFDWRDWALERRVKFVGIVALGLCNKILPTSLREIGLAEHADACERAADLAQASDAARAASDAASYAARYAASDAARAASDAARDAARAARAASYAARYAARAASDAARYAASDAASHAASHAASDAASYAAKLEVLRSMCRLLVEAAEASV